MLLLITKKDAMRKENGTAPALRVQTGKDMLEESIISTALRRNTIDIAPIGISFPCRTIPLLDGVRWIGKYHIKLAQMITFNKFRFSKCVASLNVKIFNTVQKKVHSRNR